MLAWIAEVTGARSARRPDRIQSLWSGYGELVRVELEDGPAPSVVVKCVRPPATALDSISDARKRQSYVVEAAFYRDLAPRCDDTCRVAHLYGHRQVGGEMLLVLEDLDAAGFAQRHDEADGDALAACLAWLAAFHARFLDEPAPSLWPRGTYWQLATRRDELAAIVDPELRTAAPALDAQLAAARYQTVLHGDPKEANFCFARRSVAAVDFQYAGRGCAMRDVAYLLYGRGDEAAEPTHLATYFGHLRRVLGEHADLVEAEWRALYPIARLDFCRFLAGWRPQMWQHDHRGQRYVRAYLRG